MAYVLIEDARGGVDRRRPIHALKPGTLWTCINAHITNGGDIEKRKAFVSQGVFSANTFDLAAQGDTLYTFGSDDAVSVSVPSGVQYQQLSSPPNGPMTGVVDWDLFTGKLYVAARFADGAVQHFYDGTLIDAWNSGIVRSSMGSMANVAGTLAAYVNAQAPTRYAAAWGGGITFTVTAVVPGVGFTAQTFSANGGIVDDQAFSSVVTVANVAEVVGVEPSIALSVQGGAGSGELTSFRINGVEVLSGAVTWATDNTTFATDIAAAITGGGYVATASGESVTVKAPTTGVTENGYSVEVTTTGTALVGDQSAAGTSTVGTMQGGVTPVAAVAQVNTFTVGGTFDAGDRFGFTLTSSDPTPVVNYFGNIANPWGNASTVKTHKRKMYAGAGGVLDFSGVNDATAWNVDTAPGAGFLIAANHIGGSETISSLETYQGRLAVFSRRAIQLWTMQNDDALNVPEQFIEHTGTRSPRSTLEFGGNDVFYLDDSGINSLKARDASNNAFVSGVAAAINKLVRQWMRTVTDSDVERAASAVEPEEARFWMAIGGRIFVYSFFPSAGVAAWSWYEPGFTVESFARTTNRIYARAANTLYLYGGTSGEEYDASRVEVQFPFITAGKPGNFKNLLGLNMAAEGTWSCKLKINPNNLYDEVQAGSDTGVTFPSEGWGIVGHTTHVAPLFTHAIAEYASLSQLSVRYKGAEEA